MPIQIIGYSGTIAEVESTQAVRISTRGLDHGALGSYRISALTGTMAATLAGNSEIFQMRWTDPTRFCVIEKVSLDGIGSVTALSQGDTFLRLSRCDNWSVDGSGGTTLTPTSTSTYKLRASHNPSLFATGSIRISSTTSLNVGTKSIEFPDIGEIVGSFVSVAGAYFPPGIFYDSMGGGHPIVLSQNEGIIIRCLIQPVGTWIGSITVHWTEMTAY